MNSQQKQPILQLPLSITKETFGNFFSHQPFQLAAALSYYTMLSLAPLLLVVIGAAGMIFGEKAARGELVGKIGAMMGGQQAQAIQTMIAHAGRSNTDVISTIVGIVMLFIGATTVFGSLQVALNQIFGVKTAPDTNALWSLIRARLLSLGVVFGLGFVLLVSLLLSAAISGLHSYIGALFPGATILIRIVNILVSFGVILVVIAMIYKFLPAVNIAWRDVWIGAAVTTILFTIGKYVIGLYLGHASIGSSYGAAGSIVVLLVWVYYASLILFLGAEATRAYAERGGKELEPTQHARVIE